jgi:hypothetical protein
MTDLLSIGKQELERPPVLSRQLEPDLVPNVKWELKRPGTLSKIHFQRMQIEILDRLPVDEKTLASIFPGIRDGRYQTANEISISNSLGASPESDGTLDCLEDIVK